MHLNCKNAALPNLNSKLRESVRSDPPNRCRRRPWRALHRMFPKPHSLSLVIQTAPGGAEMKNLDNLDKNNFVVFSTAVFTQKTPSNKSEIMYNFKMIYGKQFKGENLQ